MFKNYFIIMFMLTFFWFTNTTSFSQDSLITPENIDQLSPTILHPGEEIGVVGAHLNFQIEGDFQGNLIAIANTSGSDPLVLMWDLNSSTNVLQEATLNGFDWVYALSSAEITDHVLVSHDDNRKISSIGNPIRQLEFGYGELNTFQINHDGTQFAVVLDMERGENAEILIYDYETFELVKTISTEHERDINSVAFSSDGEKMASSGGGITTIWDAKTYEPIVTLDVRSNFVHFSPDGTLLTNGTSIWTADGTNLVADLVLPDGNAENYSGSFAFSPDNSMLFVAISNSNADRLEVPNGTIGVWDVAEGEFLAFLQPPSEIPESVATPRDIEVSPDGSYLVVTHWNASIVLWKIV